MTMQNTVASMGNWNKGATTMMYDSSGFSVRDRGGRGRKRGRAEERKRDKDREKEIERKK